MATSVAFELLDGFRKVAVGLSLPEDPWLGCGDDAHRRLNRDSELSRAEGPDCGHETEGPHGLSPAPDTLEHGDHRT